MRSSSGVPNFFMRATTADVAAQFLEAVIAHRHAEILAGDIFDFVRFVEDDGVIFGQDAALVVSRPCSDRSAKNRWWLTMMMSLSTARWCIRVMKQRSKLRHFAPVQRSLRASILAHGVARLGQRLDLRAIAEFGGLFPVANDLEIGHFFEPGQHRLVLGIVDLLPAGVVVAALHVADSAAAAENAAAGTERP